MLVRMFLSVTTLSSCIFWSVYTLSLFENIYKDILMFDEAKNNTKR